MATSTPYNAYRFYGGSAGPLADGWVPLFDFTLPEPPEPPPPAPNEVVVSSTEPTDPDVELWYDTDEPDPPPAPLDLTTRMMINQRFAFGNGAGSTSSTTYVNVPCTPTLTLAGFQKLAADSLLVVALHTSFYTSGTGFLIYGVQIGSTDYTMINGFSNVASQHDGRSIERAISGIPAGTFNINARCAAGSGTTLIHDANDTLSLSVREVRRS